MIRKTTTKTRTTKLAIAMALWAMAFASVARAQTAGNLKELAVSSDRHATDVAPVSLSRGRDHISSEIRSEGPMDLTLNATSGSATAGDPLATWPGDVAADKDSAALPLLMAHAGEGPLSGVVPSAVLPPPNCASVTAQFPFFPLRFNRPETGIFTAEFDAIPGGTDGSIVGLSQQPDLDHLAAYIIFSSDGTIQAQNLEQYNAATVVRYTPGVRDPFVFYVGVTGHIYSVLVTPEGGAQQLLALFYRFRITQLGTTNLDYWDLYTVSSHALKVCNFNLH
jgi:hypothetical protein